MFGIDTLYPLIYATLLLIKTIAPNYVLAATKRYIAYIVQYRKVDRSQRSESFEEPFLRELGNSAESEES